MSSGNAIVVTIRRVVEGLTFRVSSAGVALRLLPAVRGLPELTGPVVDVDMMLSSAATADALGIHCARGHLSRRIITDAMHVQH
jgi:hypothetical protein